MTDQPNPGLASMLPHMDKIRQAGTETMVTSFPIYNLFEGDMSSFYRYSGSLTTPDCNEIVQVIKCTNVSCINYHYIFTVDCGA